MKTTELAEQASRLPPTDQAGYISSKLPQVLAESRISMWHPATLIPAIGRRIVIGIAPYSLPELELLDQVRESLEKSAMADTRTEIFDVLTCSTMADFNQRVPGVGDVFQTPVIGVWENGVLTQKASGARAHQLIAGLFGLA